MSSEVVESMENVEIIEEPASYKWRVNWLNTIAMGILHLSAIYGWTLVFQAKLGSIILAKTIALLSTLGVTAGGHRLWCHKTYKANTVCQTILMCMMSSTYQNSIFTWCRDHRLHHQYSEQPPDPHNAKRGFFFSHVGWLLLHREKIVIEKQRLIDMSDLRANKVVMFQHNYYKRIVFFWTVFLPMFISMYFFGESLKIAFFYVVVYRYIISVNLTWCINSVAHLYGDKPYDKNIGPTESPIMKYLGTGEGFHNYHHTFPWDYKAAELGGDIRNFTTLLIDSFARLGWVTDRKTATPEMIKARVERTGDGTYTVDDGFVKYFSQYISREKVLEARRIVVIVIYCLLL